MELDEAQLAAVDLAGNVKQKLVSFATSRPFERHLRRLTREVRGRRPDSVAVRAGGAVAGWRYGMVA